MPTKFSVAAPERATPSAALGRAFSPVASVPMYTPVMSLYRAPLAELDAIPGVVRDDLGGCGGAADDVVRRPEDDGHAAGAVAVGVPAPSVPWRPVMSVPMKSPSTALLFVPASVI